MKSTVVLFSIWIWTFTSSPQEPKQAQKPPQDTIRVRIDTVGKKPLPLLEYKHVPDTLFEKRQREQQVAIEKLIQQKKQKTVKQ